MGGRLYILLFLLPLALPSALHAIECDEAASIAKGQCAAAVAGVNAADQASSAAGSAEAAGQGMNNMGSSNLCPKIAQQKAAIDKANTDCDTAKKTCRDQCKADEAQGQGHEGHNQPGKCDAAVDPEKSGLTNSGAPLPGQAGQACDSGKQADGKMPPISPPPPSPSPTPTPPPNPTAANCSDPSSATQSSCSDPLVAKCTPGLSPSGTSDPTCDAFTAHYCNATPPPASADPFANSLNTGTSRPGAGAGTQYCNLATAKNFCQDPARSQARSDCSTCQNYRAATSPDCQANPSQCLQSSTSGSCPDVQPPITSLAGAPSAGGTPSTGGGGGGVMAAVAGAVKASALTAAKEGANNGKPNMDMSVGSGGGGGGSGGGGSASASDFKLKFLGAAKVPGKNGTARGLAGGVEVAVKTGPSLFSISTAIYHNLCERGRLHHCGSAKN